MSQLQSVVDQVSSNYVNTVENYLDLFNQRKGQKYRDNLHLQTIVWSFYTREDEVRE